MIKHYTCAIDFGTSNSVICAISDTGESTIVNEATVLFFPKRKTSQDFVVYIGNEAVEKYVALGMQGRFVQSLKSILHDPDFDFTLIDGVPFTPVELVALVLENLKKKMEAKIGQPLTRVVMGRPVFFSEDPIEDQTAQRRIGIAAKHCGFKDVSFQLEPIGAAYAYENIIDKPMTALVVDLGGGTTDFTIMKMDPAKRGQADRSEDIKATGGVHIGGDDFDASIMWHKLTDFFGRQSQFEEMGRYYEFPSHFFNILCTWYDIAKLKASPFKETLKEILRTSTDKPAVKRLKTLIDMDLGFGVFKAIERAKKDLSTQRESAIRFSATDLEINQPITQQEFEANMKDYLNQIDNALSETLKKASLKESDIDSVLLTGGSSLVKIIQELLKNRFGVAKIVTDQNCFNTVALGLALSKKSS